MSRVQGVVGGLVLALLLGGCASTREAVGKAWQVVKDPSIPVGHPEVQPTRVDLAMVAEPNVNADDEGAGAPLRFQILQLKDDSMLMAADHQQLLDDLPGVLGTNYLSHDDFTLLPGQWKFYEPFEVDEQARYLGIIAFYREPDSAQWKKVVRIMPQGRTYHLLVHLRELEVELRKEE